MPRKLPDLNSKFAKVQPLESRIVSRVPCIMTSVGTTGSGKSYLTVAVIYKMQREGTITRLYLISPTASSNTLYRNIIDKEGRGDKVYEELGAAVFDSLKEIQEDMNAQADAYTEKLKYCVAYEKFVQGEVITDQDAMLLENGGFQKITPARPSFALFVDDAQNSAIFSRSSKNPFSNLVLRSRHCGKGLGCSIFLAAQSVRGGVPKALRLNSTHWAMFRTLNRSEVEALYEEVSGFCRKEEFERLFALFTLPERGYLFADIPNKRLSNSF